MTKEIRLCGVYSDHVAIVDDEQHPRLSRIEWYGHSGRNGTVYARYQKGRGVYTVSVYMHHCVLRLPARSLLVPDHINGDGLDNRRENLRAVSLSQNARNNHHRRNGAPVGVSFDWDGRYRARINRSNHDYSLGRFDTEAGAVAVVQRFEREHAHISDVNHKEFLAYVQNWRRGV
jgi:hypothetical protein